MKLLHTQGQPKTRPFQSCHFDSILQEIKRDKNGSINGESDKSLTISESDRNAFISSLINSSHGDLGFILIGIEIHRIIAEHHAVYGRIPVCFPVLLFYLFSAHSMASSFVYFPDETHPSPKST